MLLSQLFVYELWRLYWPYYSAIFNALALLSYSGDESQEDESFSILRWPRWDAFCFAMYRLWIGLWWVHCCSAGSGMKDKMKETACLMKFPHPCILDSVVQRSSGWRCYSLQMPSWVPGLKCPHCLMISHSRSPNINQCSNQPPPRRFFGFSFT